jgi:hypothetical protein
MEHRILECLIRHAPEIATHGQILKEVWGPCQDDTRSLRVLVNNLRRKLEPDPVSPKHILTTPGVGYRLSVSCSGNRPGPAGEMIYTESHEPALDLRDEAVLNAEGLLLALVGVYTRIEIKPAAAMLQVVDELVDGDVVFGGVGQIGPDVDDIMVLVQPINRAGDMILARPMTEPTSRFELNFGQSVGNGITG